MPFLSLVTLTFDLQTHPACRKPVPCHLSSKGCIPEQMKEETNGDWMIQVHLENDY